MWFVIGGDCEGLVFTIDFYGAPHAIRVCDRNFINI